MKVVAVDNNRPESKPLASTELVPNSILVFGSESDGISQELLDAADQSGGLLGPTGLKHGMPYAQGLLMGEEPIASML